MKSESLYLFFFNFVVPKIIEKTGKNKHLQKVYGTHCLLPSGRVKALPVLNAS